MRVSLPIFNLFHEERWYIKAYYYHYFFTTSIVYHVRLPQSGDFKVSFSDQCISLECRDLCYGHTTQGTQNYTNNEITDHCILHFINSGSDESIQAQLLSECIHSLFLRAREPVCAISLGVRFSAASNKRATSLPEDSDTEYSMLCCHCEEVVNEQSMD